jgi:hypothetical protein
VTTSDSRAVCLCPLRSGRFQLVTLRREQLSRQDRTGDREAKSKESANCPVASDRSGCHIDLFRGPPWRLACLEEAPKPTLHSPTSEVRFIEPVATSWLHCKELPCEGVTTQLLAQPSFYSFSMLLQYYSLHVVLLATKPPHITPPTARRLQFPPMSFLPLFFVASFLTSCSHLKLGLLRKRFPCSFVFTNFPGIPRTVASVLCACLHEPHRRTCESDKRPVKDERLKRGSYALWAHAT